MYAISKEIKKTMTLIISNKLNLTRLTKPGQLPFFTILYKYDEFDRPPNQRPSSGSLAKRPSKARPPPSS